jgi:hypothetical protein
MRREDITKLSAPYPTDGTEAPPPTQILGVQVRCWDELEEAINSDLTVAAPWGISWWAPSPGTSRRILISDQLHCCARSVNQNLIEAALHWLEYQDWLERESNRNADVVKVVAGRLHIKMTPPANTLEAIGDRLITMQVVGVARALSGVLDCLAGTIIGVTGIPLQILKADLEGVRRYFTDTDKRSGPYAEGPTVQIEFGRKLEQLIAAAGPNDWLRWLLALRNTFVHRGRRIEIGQFVAREPVFYDILGNPIPRADTIMHLPLDPGRSDVEVLVEPANTPGLTEAATDTIEGLLASTKKLLDEVAKELLQVWNWRKGNTAKIAQPIKQWPDGRAAQQIGFQGYRAGTRPYNPEMLVGHPELLARIRAAALTDGDRGGWPAFG